MIGNNLHLEPPHPELTRTPADLSKFWVITVLSNPVRYKKRYELYWRFREMCHAAGVNLITVEQAFGNRKFMVTEPGNKYHLQLRTEEELWHKENMINLGVRHACAMFPGQVREVAWVDADCRPSRVPRDWFEETWHQLQHYEFVQMWEHLIDLDNDFNPIGGSQPGFMANYVKLGTPNPEEMIRMNNEAKAKAQYVGGYNATGTIFGRPGLAWAASLSAFSKVGGLLQQCVLGAGDWYMAHGLLGSMSVTTERSSSAYVESLYRWQDLAERWIKRDVGYVSGTVYHDFHGRKALRFYNTRGKILVDNKFNPDTDLKPDSQGLLQLETWEPRQIKLRDQIRGYFRARNEDSIDL